MPSLIEYNRADCRKDEEENRQLVESLRAKAGPDNYENSFGFKWSDEQGEDEEQITKANLIEIFLKAS